MDIKKKMKRLAIKLIHNLKSVFFLLAYYTVELPWISYNKYIKKRSIKNCAINYPIIDLIDFNGIEFLIYFENKGIIEELILKEGFYEGEILKIADGFIQEKTVIIDVGANIGFESLYFARKYPGCLVYSYEPASLAYRCLHKSREINSLSNLKLFKLGVGDSCGQMEIHAPTASTYNKGLASIPNNCDLDDTFVKEKIEIVTLDDHVQEPLRVSFIKIDVQGFESKVLKGALGLIEKNRPVIIFEHSDQYYEHPLEERKKIQALFSSLDYEFYLIRSGLRKRPYTFLEKIDLVSEKENNGNLAALPGGFSTERFKK